MSTDLVSVTKPTVINSYQDIMNRPNMTLLFGAIMTDTQEFEDAYEDDDDSSFSENHSSGDRGRIITTEIIFITFS